MKKGGPDRFILASESPRRRRMLREMGVDFEVIPSRIPEDSNKGEDARETALRLALAKASHVAQANPDALVLGVDTMVVIKGEVLGKPRDATDAKRMLETLAGKRHTVITAYALLAETFGIRVLRAVSTEVTLRPLDPERIRWYLKSGESRDKAGAYAIQGLGASLVRRVEGSYTCVVGLPLAEMVEDIENLFGPEWLFQKRARSNRK